MYALLRGSPLAFPNRRPRFDPAHPASNNLRFSCVSADGNFINLATGQPASPTGSMPSKMYGSIGGATVCNSNYATVSGLPTASEAAITLAAIFVSDGTPTNYGTIVGSSSSTDSYGCALMCANTNQFNARLFGTDNYFGGTGLLVAGGPVFVAVSVNLTTLEMNWVACRLDNGLIFSKTSTANSGTQNPASGTGIVGGGDYNFATGSIAAVASSGAFLSMSQLLQWAADPWSFWYPRGVFHSLDWLGKASSGGTAYSLACGEGTFNFTGNALTENIGRQMALGEGTFTFTGEPLSGNSARNMSLAKGTFTFTGEPLTENIGRTLSLGEGSFTFTGKALTENVGRQMSLSPGSFTFTGKPMSFAVALSLLAQAGSFVFTGGAAVLNYVPSGTAVINFGKKFLAAVGSLMGSYGDPPS